MAQNYKIYPNKKFNAGTVQQAFALFESLSTSELCKEPVSSIYNIEYENQQSFLNGLDDSVDGAEMFVRLKNGASFSMKYQAGHTEIRLNHSEEKKLAEILTVFDQA